MVATTTTGMFLVCFDALCPCFGSKRKDGSEDPVLARDANSSSSSELRSISDRIPASPLRVPASPSRFSLSSPPSRNEPLNLSLEQVIKLTHNFSPALMIGEGYFGKVYRAELRDGHVVAIKRAKKEHFASLRAEFSNEIALLKKIEHRSLVQLLGYIEKGNERIIITEYVSNGTLREHLDGQRGLILGFSQRLEIAIDVAHGLTYLHLYAGRRPIEVRRGSRERITVRWAFEKYNTGDVKDILDPMLTESINGDILNKTFGVAFECVAPTRADRPHMKEVVEMLWKIRRDYAKTQSRAEVSL